MTEVCELMLGQGSKRDVLEQCQVSSEKGGKPDAVINGTQWLVWFCDVMRGKEDEVAV